MNYDIEKDKFMMVIHNDVRKPMLALKSFNVYKVLAEANIESNNKPGAISSDGLKYLVDNGYILEITTPPEIPGVCVKLA